MVNPKCHSCETGRLEIKSITHFINGGKNTAMIDIEAEACETCGEILFTPSQEKFFEEIKKKLEHGQTQDFIPIGTNYKVA